MELGAKNVNAEITRHFVIELFLFGQKLMLK